MIVLCLSILCSTLIFIVFRLFKNYQIDIMPAIVTNYFTASICGIINSMPEYDPILILKSKWLPGTILLGVLFVSIFQAIAKSSQHLGVATTAIATKMSLVIPAVISVLYYNEELTIYKILGILIALVAVYLSSKRYDNLPMDRRGILLILLVFFGSGFVDSGINYFERLHLTPKEFPLFSSTVFFSAGLAGSLVLLVKKRTKASSPIKNITAGIALGIPNYFTVYFLLAALRQFENSAATVFSVNNVSIVLLSALVSMIAFQEKKSITNWIGLGLAVASIVFIGVAEGN